MCEFLNKSNNTPHLSWDKPRDDCPFKDYCIMWKSQTLWSSGQQYQENKECIPHTVFKYDIEKKFLPYSLINISVYASNGGEFVGLTNNCSLVTAEEGIKYFINIFE